MSTNDVDYTVTIEQYAERHYVKNFEKKYNKAWAVTLKAVLEQFKRFDLLIGNFSSTEIILTKGNYLLLKHEFRVHQTKDSAKASGNRAIIFVDEVKRECQILLVYSKNDVFGSKETQWWQAAIKDNYSGIWRNFHK